MKYILREEQIISSYPNNIVFVRYKLWDNTSTVRKLPYDGINAWAIRKKDLNKYLKFYDYVKEYHPELGGGSENIEIVNPSGKKVFAIDYRRADDYVLGISDEEPKLEPFDSKKHILDFEIIFQNPYNQKDRLYKPKLTYQVILK